MRTNWAVMCGSLRSIIEFKLSLARLCDMRGRGMLEGIVFSTWKGEVDAFPGLRKTLTGLDICVVESVCPTKEQVGQRETYSIVVQKEQLFRGCLCVPEDVFILKFLSSLRQ
ncbi:MAG: hypothetical protein LBD40_02785 [Puniceicoccales bacterium]|jgi:hypothetical protein|nr:hypothetical protein [Puniceicoccales bacterium]